MPHPNVSCNFFTSIIVKRLAFHPQSLNYSCHFQFLTSFRIYCSYNNDGRDHTTSCDPTRCCTASYSQDLLEVQLLVVVLQTTDGTWLCSWSHTCSSQYGPWIGKYNIKRYNKSPELKTYCIHGIFGGGFNLTIWRIMSISPN